MCGRFTLRATPEDITRMFDLLDPFSWQPSFNIAPTQNVVGIVRNPQSEQRSAKLLRWGLIPSWAKEIGIGQRMINARSETVHEKPSFRSAFKRRRCLLIADGFYEWKREGSKKQPCFFCVKGADCFAFAGLWESWKDPSGQTIETATILTTAANPLMAKVHHRMPVILSSSEYTRWLNPNLTERADLEDLFAPFSTAKMDAFAVSSYCNSARHNDPKCLEPLDRNPEGGLF